MLATSSSGRLKGILAWWRYLNLSDCEVLPPLRRGRALYESQLNSLRSHHMQLIIAHYDIDWRSIFVLSLPLTALFIVYEQHEKPGQRRMDGRPLSARMLVFR